MQRAGRIGRLVGVSTGALAGAGFGLVLAFWVVAIAWVVAGDVGGNVGLFTGAPLCVLGGAWLGARVFLRFRAFANSVRLRHTRAGGLAWVLGSISLVLVAGLGSLLGAVIIYGLFD